MSTAPEPLLDLSGLAAGLRWRRRTWVGLALAGLLLGVLSTVVLPSGSTAVTRVHVTHEEESFTNATTIGETDVALFETTQVAAAALQRMGDPAVTPAQLLAAYQVKAVAANVLELTVTGRDGAGALARAQALADAYIATHVGRIQDAADAEAAALTDRRDAAQAQLDDLADQISDVAAQPVTPATAAQLEALYAARAGLDGQIQDLGQRAEEASIGAPRVAAGTTIVDAPRIAGRSPLVAAGIAGAIGLVLGLGVGLGVALVGAVVADRPVLRRDVAAHLGASVIAQLPAPRRGPSRLVNRSGPAAERRRAAAVLARLVGPEPGAVSLLEVGCPRLAAALAVDIAAELVVDRDVVLVDDLPGRDVQAAGPAAPVEVVDGASHPAGPPAAGTCYLGVGSAGPDTAWSDLARLGTETLLVVRAGAASTARLHEVARQLADVGIHVIGVVLVHPDPRDRTDGTLWDGLHHALRGRAAALAAGRHPDELVLVPASGADPAGASGHGPGTNGNGRATAAATPTGDDGPSGADVEGPDVEGADVGIEVGVGSAPGGTASNGTGKKGNGTAKNRTAGAGARSSRNGTGPSVDVTAGDDVEVT
ncbi:Wzz/FepE/Etk N-terminal domain-containing protein [Pseudonocardia petroleophila]|uniref:Polysaccharide biosynthesis protein n=1 Tax=Pseudonocardia petroleophila TaxID=37331 RepID=A0A7G7MQH9_9PSEU|nr:polysaccharide biosynthesis protein [Pseudonocardia petroleophila]QNG55040.1 polysaccharide biosynthesis protein [Pseudonocardia petroleophila]